MTTQTTQATEMPSAQLYSPCVNALTTHASACCTSLLISILPSNSQPALETKVPKELSHVLHDGDLHAE
jgi:hypothetical protein